MVPRDDREVQDRQQGQVQVPPPLYDGADDLVQLDDEDLKSIKVLDERIERCTCDKCTAIDEAGRALPLP